MQKRSQQQLSSSTVQTPSSVVGSSSLMAQVLQQQNSGAGKAITGSAKKKKTKTNFITKTRKAKAKVNESTLSASNKGSISSVANSNSNANNFDSTDYAVQSGSSPEGVQTLDNQDYLVQANLEVDEQQQMQYRAPFEEDEFLMMQQKQTPSSQSPSGLVLGDQVQNQMLYNISNEQINIKGYRQKQVQQSYKVRISDLDANIDSNKEKNVAMFEQQYRQEQQLFNLDKVVMDDRLIASQSNQLLLDSKMTAAFPSTVKHDKNYEGAAIISQDDEERLEYLDRVPFAQHLNLAQQNSESEVTAMDYGNLHTDNDNNLMTNPGSRASIEAHRISDTMMHQHQKRNNSSHLFDRDNGGHMMISPLQMSFGDNKQPLNIPRRNTQVNNAKKRSIGDSGSLNSLMNPQGGQAIDTVSSQNMEKYLQAHIGSFQDQDREKLIDTKDISGMMLGVIPVVTSAADSLPMTPNSQVPQIGQHQRVNSQKKTQQQRPAQSKKKGLKNVLKLALEENSPLRQQQKPEQKIVAVHTVNTSETAAFVESFGTGNNTTDVMDLDELMNTKHKLDQLMNSKHKQEAAKNAISASRQQPLFIDSFHTQDKVRGPENQTSALQSPTLGQQQFLPDLQIGDLATQNRAKQNDTINFENNGGVKQPAAIVSINRQRATQMALGQGSSKFYERLETSQSNHKRLRQNQQDLKISQTESQPKRKRPFSSVGQNQNLSNTNTNTNGNNSNRQQNGKFVDGALFEKVENAMKTVIQRKNLLTRGTLNSSSIPDVQQDKLIRSDIREVFRELKIVKQSTVSRDRARSRSQLSSQNQASAQKAQATVNRPFIEQETLIDQLEALFFAQQVTAIDCTYLQEFLLVLMQPNLSSIDQKIPILQKIIQESINSAKLGQSLPVKLASQKLFQLERRESHEIHPLQQSVNSDFSQLGTPRETELGRHSRKNSAKPGKEQEIIEIQQKMFIAQLERQLIQQAISQYEIVHQAVKSEENYSRQAQYARGEQQQTSPKVANGAAGRKSEFAVRLSGIGINRSNDQMSSPRAKSNYTGYRPKKKIKHHTNNRAQSDCDVKITEGGHTHEVPNIFQENFQTDLNQEFERAFDEAIRRASEMTPTRSKNTRHSFVLQGEADDSQEVLVDDNQDVDDSDECNIEDDEDLGGTPPSSDDGSAGSTPRDDEQVLDDFEDFSVEEESRPSMVSKVSARNRPDFSGTGNYAVLHTEEIRDDVDNPNTPFKKMRAVGRICASSIGSNYNYNNRIDQNASSLGGQSNKSKSLSKNMRHLEMNKKGKSPSVASSLAHDSQGNNGYGGVGRGSQKSNSYHHHQFQGLTEEKINLNKNAIMTSSFKAYNHQQDQDQLRFPSEQENYGPKSHSFSQDINRRQNKYFQQKDKKEVDAYVDDQLNNSLYGRQSFNKLILPDGADERNAISSMRGHANIGGIQNNQNIKLDHDTPLISHETLEQNTVGNKNHRSTNSAATASLMPIPTSIKPAMGYNKPNFEAHKQPHPMFFGNNEYGNNNNQAYGGDVINANKSPFLDSQRRSLQSTVGVDYSNTVTNPEAQFMQNSMRRSQRYFQDNEGQGEPLQNTSNQKATGGGDIANPFGSVTSSSASQRKNAQSQPARSNQNPAAKRRQKQEASLRYQIDIQISPKKMLVVKIYEGDKAEDILSNLTSNKDLELDEEDIVNIERVIRHHCRP